MKYYKAGYGCYLEEIEVGVKSSQSLKALERYVYESAYQTTEGWLGMHGFECENCEGIGGDCCHETIEAACFYWIKECSKEEAEEFAELHNGMETW